MGIFNNLCDVQFESQDNKFQLGSSSKEFYYQESKCFSLTLLYSEQPKLHRVLAVLNYVLHYCFRSGNRTTLFLGRLRPPKQLTST